jgi:alkaline phosphatase
MMIELINSHLTNNYLKPKLKILSRIGSKFVTFIGYHKAIDNIIFKRNQEVKKIILYMNIALLGLANSSYSSGETSLYNLQQQKIERAKSQLPNDKYAKNIILFIGDGMSLGTITAARIYAGQKEGEDGESYRLSFEDFPYVAISKTYNTNMQTPDSAGTATAMVTGHKTKSGIINLSDEAKRGICNGINSYKLKNIFEIAYQKGLSVGVVTTTRITHATPAAVYAYSPDRDWESDGLLSKAGKDGGCQDIASQLINQSDKIQVALGGGLEMFVLEQDGGKRQSEDLVKRWRSLYPKGNYVTDKKSLMAIAPSSDTKLLGLFAPSHMPYVLDRGDETPSLPQMTQKAIEVLSINPKGYILMVEGGRIDHAHHNGNAHRALAEARELDQTVTKALSMVDTRDTLIIVTADHSHSFVMNGYVGRNNNILGLSRDEDGQINKDINGHSYTTISYSNGLGSKQGDRQLTDKMVFDKDYKQNALIPLKSQTHSAEDVVVSAIGPKAWLFQGFVEQSYIFQVMNEALGISRNK